jgi:ABC-type glycerol-3-phosphate transport system substrate-binding protein
VDDFARDAQGFSADDFTPVSLQALRSDGRLFGLPMWTSTNVLRYSERMLERAGVVPAGAAGWSWADFVDAARRLTTFDTPGAPSQCGVWLAPGSYPSQQWIWQNGGAVVDLEGKKPLVAEPNAVAAVEFMARLQSEGIGPQLDLSEGNPPHIEFRGGTTSVGGVPVAMIPARIGGGFGASGVGYFFASAGDGGAFSHRIGTSQGRPFNDHSAPGNEATAAPEAPDRLGLMGLPHQTASASEAGVIGLISLLSTSQNSRAAFQMMDWLATKIGNQAAIPARRPTVGQLLALGGEYSEADAQTIVASAYTGRTIPGRQSSAIARVLLEEIDLPILTADEDPITATTNANERIDALLNDG